MNVRVGLQISGVVSLGDTSIMGSAVGQVAEIADRSGFYSLWLPDHLLNAMAVFGQPIDGPILEGYCTISYLAGLTERVKLGLLVSCNLFRHAAVLVKMISTINILSGGRSYCGLGAGWFEREERALGIPFHILRERYDRLEETLQIAKHLWSSNSDPFTGKYYTLTEPICSPQPLTRPHPPILIGGESKRVLRMVAEYGDACNVGIGSASEESIDFVRQKLGILRQQCKEIGRSFDEVEKSVQVFFKTGLDQQKPLDVITLCNRLAELGTQHVIFNYFPTTTNIPALKSVALEIAPQVSSI